MLSRLRQLLALPALEEDEDRRQLARLVHWLSLILLLGLGLYCLTLLLFVPVLLSRLGLLLPPLGVLLLSWGLNRRGRVTAAGALLIVGLWSTLLLAAFYSGGVRASGYSGLILMVLFAGLLLGRRAAVATALGSILAGAGLLAAEVMGWLPPALGSGISLTYWIATAIYLAVAAGLLQLATVGVREALQRARHELAERQQAEAQLQMALEAANLGTWRWDIASGRMEWSAQAAAFFGPPPAQPPADYPAYLAGLHPADRPDLERAVEAVLRGDAVRLASEHRLVGPPAPGAALSPQVERAGDGERRAGRQAWVELRGQLLDAGRGAATQVVGTIAEISTRKRAETELNEARAMLQTALEASPAGVMLATAPNQQVGLINSAAREILGLGAEASPADGLPPAGWRSRYPDHTPVLPADQPLARAIRGGETTQDMELILERPDGQERWVLINAAPIRDAAGSVVAGIAVFMDLTARKRSQEALARSVQEIEALYQASQELAACRSVEQVCQAANRAANHLLPGEVFILSQLDEAHQEIEVIYLMDWDQRIPPARFPLGQGLSGRVIASGRPWRTNDLQEVNDLQGVHRGRPSRVRSIVAVPLRTGDRTFGMLSVQSYSPQAYTDEHEKRLTTLANQVAIALQQVALLTETAEALTREQGLNEMARLIGGTLEVERLIPHIVEHVLALVSADAGFVDLIEPDGAGLRLEHAVRLGGPALQLASRLTSGTGIAGQIAQSRQAVRVDEYAAHPQAMAELVAAGARAYLGVPLIAGEACLGVLGLLSFNPERRFSGRDQALAEAVGRQAGLALQNARLFAALQQRLQEAHTLYEISQGITAALNLEETLAGAVTRLQFGFHYYHVHMYTVDADSGQLVMRHGSGPIGAELKRRGHRLDPGVGIVGHVAASGRPFLTNAVETVPFFHRNPLLPDTRSEMAVPLRAGAQVLGVLDIQHTGERDLDEHDQRLVMTVADLLAAALQKAILFEATRRQLSELTTLHELAQAIAGAHSEAELVERASELIHQTLRPDLLDVLLLDASAGQLIAHPSALAQHLAPLSAPIALGEGITGTVAVIGRPWRVPDVRQERAYLPARIERYADLRSELAVPLKAGEHLLGVVNVESVRLNAFSEADERLLVTLAGQLATALERLRAEAQVRQLNQALEQRVAERTAQLEAANRELESFSYSVSHDLRTPLRAVEGFSRLLLEDHAETLTPQVRHYLERIRQNAQRMAELIGDLLNLSRLGQQVLRRQPVDTAGLVRQAWEELEPEWGRRPVELTLEVLPRCQADASLLKQVWLNLLSNALKFSRGRSPARIHVGWQAQAGLTVYFVRDNGVGFGMQSSEKLFGVFQRLHAAEEYEGSGVGLAIVQRIVHRHGGRAWAEAGEGQGATFFFTLPGG